jgi:hypothetical protein
MLNLFALFPFRIMACAVDSFNLIWSLAFLISSLLVVEGGLGMMLDELRRDC